MTTVTSSKFFTTATFFDDKNNVIDFIAENNIYQVSQKNVYKVVTKKAKRIRAY